MQQKLFFTDGQRTEVELSHETLTSVELSHF